MQSNKDLKTTINGDRRFSTFAKILESSNAMALLEDGGEFTVFAPTNDAFTKIPPATMNRWLNEPGQRCLRSLLHYHIIPGKILAGDIATASVRMSSAGEEVRFTDNHGLKVNESRVTSRNILASNGIIHALDTVLIRPSEFLSLFPLEPTYMDIPLALPLLTPEADPLIDPIRSGPHRQAKATYII